MRTIHHHEVEGNTEPLNISVLDEPSDGGACHHYAISFGDPEDRTGLSQKTAHILFQKGPIKENGVNGISGESLMAILIDRLESFQAGEYSSQDNQESLSHLRSALVAQQRRTRARVARGVEGTSSK